jgi:hypothetical protein
MNINFLAIVKRIVSEQGESILAEPQRLKSWISDYAKDEPKAERLVLGRYIEAGAYAELKKAASPVERRRVKAALVQCLHNDQGLDTALCAGALDLLEAALWGTNEPPKDTQTPVPHSIEPPAPSVLEVSVPPAGNVPAADSATMSSDKILIWSSLSSIVIASAVVICIFATSDLSIFVRILIAWVIFITVMCIVYPIGKKIFGQRKGVTHEHKSA